MKMRQELRGTGTVFRRLLWCTVAILVAIGSAAAVNRTLAVANEGFFDDELYLTLSTTAVQEMKEYDRGFENHPILTFLHIIPGGVFLILAPFQFSSRIRTRNVRFHRLSGRVLVVAALIAGVSALILLVPFAFTGPIASSAVILFGTLFLFAVVRGFIAIRHHDVVRHREWMIRAFSVGVGVSTIRVVAMLLFTITRANPFELLAASFWIGWILTFSTAEFWIRHTRMRWGSMSSPAIGATET